jgi:hypothetical protein
MWTKLDPPCQRLRSFGCKAYIAVPKKNRAWKPGNTGDVGILLGFENEGSVYQILCLRDKKLIKTRHAKFDKTVFLKLSNDSVPFAMSKQLLDGEVAHDSFEADLDCLSVSTHEDSEKPSEEAHNICSDKPLDSSQPF